MHIHFFRQIQRWTEFQIFIFRKLRRIIILGVSSAALDNILGIIHAVLEKYDLKIICTESRLPLVWIRSQPRQADSSFPTCVVATRFASRSSTLFEPPDRSYRPNGVRPNLLPPEWIRRLRDGKRGMFRLRCRCVRAFVRGSSKTSLARFHSKRMRDGKKNSGHHAIWQPDNRRPHSMTRLQDNVAASFVALDSFWPAMRLVGFPERRGRWIRAVAEMQIFAQGTDLPAKNAEKGHACQLWGTCDRLSPSTFLQGGN